MGMLSLNALMKRVIRLKRVRCGIRISIAPGSERAITLLLLLLLLLLCNRSLVHAELSRMFWLDA